MLIEGEEDEHSQSRGLSASVFSHLVELPDPIVLHPEDLPLLRGMRDFLEIQGGRLEPVAPARLVRAVLRLCRFRGMKPAQFASAIAQEDTGQLWSRYYRQGQQMRVATLRRFIDEAVARGWLDVRLCPTDPHPSTFGWHAPEHVLRSWRAYEAPLVSSTLKERLQAIEACILLARKRDRITLDAVRAIALVDLDLERRHRRDSRSHAQRLRRAKEELGDAYPLVFMQL